MAEERKLHCKQISEITDDLTDKAIGLYYENKMVAFWDAVNALDMLTDVRDKVCYIE